MSIFDPSIAVTSCKLISSFPERPAHFFGEAFVTVPIARAPTGMTTYPLITTSFATVNRMRWPSIARAELIVSASLRSTSVPSGTTETPLVTGVGATVVSVLSTCVTKHTKDMVYSEARRLWFFSSEQFRTILNALERESDHGSASAVFSQLSKRRDVRSGLVSRVWNIAPHSLSLDKPI